MPPEDPRSPDGVVTRFLSSNAGRSPQEAAAAAFLLADGLSPTARHEVGVRAFKMMLFLQAEKQEAGEARLYQLLRALRWAQAATIGAQYCLHPSASTADPLPFGLALAEEAVPALRMEGPFGLALTPGGAPVAVILEPPAWVNEYDPDLRADAQTQAGMLQTDLHDALGVMDRYGDTWIVEPARGGLAELSLWQPGLTRAFVVRTR